MIYVSSAIVDTAPELCQKGDFSPEKKDEDIFVNVLKFMVTLASMQESSTLM